MLSIVISLVAIFIFRSLSRRSPTQKIWGVCFCVAVNWFLVECAVYAYLVSLVFSGKYLFLIGNQTILDKLIKRDIQARLYDRRDSHNSFYQIDPYLGYTVGKNKDYWVYHSNGQGIRADREYDLTPSPDKLRVAVFGDSYVFCDGETNENTWTNMIENKISGLELINFGVSGYGFSSSVLRYFKDGQLFNPDLIIFNYIVLGDRDWFEGDVIGGVDMQRSTLYRPLLVLSNNSVQTRNFSPIDFFDSAFRFQYLYQPLEISGQFLWNLPAFSLLNTGLAIKNIHLNNLLNSKIKDKDTDSKIKFKRYEYTEGLLKKLFEVTRKNKTMVIFLNKQNDPNDFPVSTQQLFKQHQDHVLVVNEKQIFKSFLDQLKLQPKDYLNSTNHYNVVGNRLYAAFVEMVLKGGRIGSGNRQFEYCAKTNRFQNLALEPCS